MWKGGKGGIHSTLGGSRVKGVTCVERWRLPFYGLPQILLVVQIYRVARHQSENNMFPCVLGILGDFLCFFKSIFGMYLFFPCGFTTFLDIDHIKMEESDISQN